MDATPCSLTPARSRSRTAGPLSLTSAPSNSANSRPCRTSPNHSAPLFNSTYERAPRISTPPATGSVALAPYSHVVDGHWGSSGGDWPGRPVLAQAVRLFVAAGLHVL